MALRPGTPDDAERVAAIEAAFERHWRHFGGYPGASLHDEDGVLWFASPIPYLPYNWVIRTSIPSQLAADAVIERVASSFRARDVPYMWVHRPSDRPTDLGHRLAHQGLDLVETALGMDLDLDGWLPEAPSVDVELRQVDAPGADPDGLHHYEELIRTYWSVPEAARHLIEGLNRHWTGERNPGARLVAYMDGVPVGKCFANLEDVPAWVALYGVAVRPEARGQGIATALMHRAIAIGRDAGARRAVLHSSTMAASMYRRMGFVERCRLPVYASAALFGTHHH
jgi:GNAT superfamily N-acetyltransferase